MVLGMILSVLKGKNNRGKFNLASAPISEMLKKLLLGLAKSFEAPMLPLIPISNVSAPLNTFRILKNVFPDIPKSCMLECIKSAEKPNVYFFLGDK